MKCNSVKRVLSMLLSMAMIISAVPAMICSGAAWEGYGNYPAHTEMTHRWDYISATMDAGASPAENVFTVGDKSFILLDRDSEGNYFVMAEENYGVHSYTNKNLADINTLSAKDSDWYFDPENEDSIAYWLNNGFLTDGNGTGNKLPDEIISNLVEKSWEIENNYTAGTDKIAGTESNYAEYEAWLSNRAGMREVTAKVSLPSYREYRTYEKKIGVPVRTTGVTWLGAMSRTPNSVVSITDGVISLTNYIWNIKTGSSNTKSAIASGGMFDYAAGDKKAEFLVRPVFWLSSDFFKENKISNIGENVKTQILQYGVSQMAKLYTTTELENIGFDTSEFINPWEGFGKYPEHKELKEQPFSVPGLSVGDSPSENTFKVDGKRFVLLDRDSAGNYFVIADEDYGTRAYLTDKTGVDFNGLGGKDSDWYYDPENTNSIAYWLNNDFIANGNGAGNKLPDAIVENVLEREWVVENNFTYGNGRVTVDAVGQENYDTYQAWKQNRAGMRTVTSKLALMSLTEYKTYKDKIAKQIYYLNNAAHYLGFILRTPTSTVKVADGAVTVENFIYNVRTITNNTVVAATPNATLSHNCLVRPVFWLSADFFKNEKVADAGNVVAKQILQYDIHEMNRIYTVEELAKIGFDTEGFESAWDNYGNYPEYKDLNLQQTVYGREVGDSPAENVFEVAGKKFILLDRDNDGNYFVAADDNYGTNSFVNNVSELGINSVSCFDSDWAYDPARENSIAYWLNNDFLTSGNGEGNTLPQEIIANLVEKEWTVENNLTYGMPSITVEAVGQENYDAFVEWKENRLGTRKVTSKLALMSFTEYNAYKDKIGGYVRSGDDSWSGFMMRTPLSTVSVADGGVKVLNSFYQVRTVSNNTKLGATPNGDFTKSNYLVKPVFWLKADFFKNNKVSFVANTDGVSNIKTQICQYTKDELSNIYTSEELIALGYTFDDCKMVFTDGVSELKSINGAKTVNVDLVFGPSDEGSKTVILAVYDKTGRMVGVTKDDVTLKTNDISEISVTLTGLNCTSGFKAKAMVWDNFDDMTPYFIGELD